MRLFCTPFLLLLLSLPCAAQTTLTGIWRGYFVQNDYDVLTGKFRADKYKYEVQINNLKTGAIEGVTYSYKTIVFYGKAAMQGVYTQSSQNLIIKETKMQELKISDNSFPCLMTCYLEYKKEGDKKTLTGTYTSTNEKTNTDCGGGTVYLERVNTTEFEKEPFLLKKETEKPVVKKPVVPVTKQPVPLTKKASPTTTDGTITIKKLHIPKPGAEGNLVVKDKPTTARESTVQAAPDTVMTFQRPVLPPTMIRPLLPRVLRERKNELVNTFKVDAQDVRIDYYDNGEIDNDSITVYDNNALAIDRKRLSYSPITIYLHLDETHPLHEIITVADNLGDVPPNTALMVITYGKKRHEVTITSDEKKNAKVIIEYAPEGTDVHQ